MVHTNGINRLSGYCAWFPDKKKVILTEKWMGSEALRLRLLPFGLSSLRAERIQCEAGSKTRGGMSKDGLLQRREVSAMRIHGLSF
jgi:hypothetical protein